MIAFISVGVCLIVLRRIAPDMPRLFRCPAAYMVGALTIAGCLYLLASLPTATLIRFVIWNIVRLAISFAYERRKSDVGRSEPVVAI